MNAIVLPGVRLLNVQTREEVCNCPIHENTPLQQVDGQLPNGKFVRIMLDRGLWFVAIGTPNIPDDMRPPRPVSKVQAIKLLQEAMNAE